MESERAGLVQIGQEKDECKRKWRTDPRERRKEERAVSGDWGMAGGGRLIAHGPAAESLISTSTTRYRYGFRDFFLMRIFTHVQV